MGFPAFISAAILLLSWGSSRNTQTPPEVTKEQYHALKTAAEEAIRQVRFVPGKRNGEAVDMFITLPIQFSF